MKYIMVNVVIIFLSQDIRGKKRFKYTHMNAHNEYSDPMILVIAPNNVQII
jgi:hypothetical protein